MIIKIPVQPKLISTILLSWVLSFGIYQNLTPTFTKQNSNRNTSLTKGPRGREGTRAKDNPLSAESIPPAISHIHLPREHKATRNTHPPTLTPSQGEERTEPPGGQEPEEGKEGRSQKAGDGRVPLKPNTNCTKSRMRPAKSTPAPSQNRAAHRPSRQPTTHCLFTVVFRKPHRVLHAIAHFGRQFVTERMFTSQTTQPNPQSRPITLSIHHQA